MYSFVALAQLIVTLGACVMWWRADGKLYQIEQKLEKRINLKAVLIGNQWLVGEPKVDQ